MDLEFIFIRKERNMKGIGRMMSKMERE